MHSRAAFSQSLERGLAILSCFTSGGRLLGVADLARELGLTRSTTHRYVATLAALGYLEQDKATKKYRVGSRVIRLGFSAINSMELPEIAAPHLRELSEETGRTANMAILDGVDILYIERCRSGAQREREVDLNLHVGSRLPAYCTSMGKVLLAYLPDDVRPSRLDSVDFARRGPNALTRRRDLEQELDAVRAAGIAVNNEELASGLRSIAVPVRGLGGEVVAAINLSVHHSPDSLDDLVRQLRPALGRTAAAVATRLGYWPEG